MEDTILPGNDIRFLDTDKALITYDPDGIVIITTGSDCPETLTISADSLIDVLTHYDFPFPAQSVDMSWIYAESLRVTVGDDERHVYLGRVGDTHRWYGTDGLVWTIPDVMSRDVKDITVL